MDIWNYIGFRAGNGGRRRNTLDSLFSKASDMLIVPKVNLGYIPQTAGGKIKFQSEGLETGVTQAKYMYVNEDSPEMMVKLVSDIVGKWDMNTPKLVLTIISSSSHFASWVYQEDMDNFQDGLMKAATLADMLIVLNGLNCGVTQMVGDAVAKERNRRKILAREQALLRFASGEVLPRITVIGHVPEQELVQTVADSLAESKTTSALGKTNIVINQGQQESIDLGGNQLNNNLTHFFILDKEMGAAGQDKFISRLEARLTKQLMPENDKRKSISFFDEETGPVPLIGMLVQGGPQEIDRVLALVKKNVPVIVLCGLGMAGDIIAYAVRESKQSYDTYTYEMYVKTELRRMLTAMFPDDFVGNNLARNQCRDRVLQCVTYATQGDSSLITLVDVHTQGLDLSQVILMAVLNSYKNQAEQVQLSLQLCLDWMSPELAQSEIFSKHSSNLISITDDLFLQALLRPDREEFVELFLDRGFVLYKFLSQARLQLLFEKCQDKDFFVGICLETILGEKVTHNRSISANFLTGLKCKLNKLLRILTGLKKLINPTMLTSNAGKERVDSPAVAENKAIHALLYWAALTNKVRLVRILWSRSDQPIAMALTLSNLYNHMAERWITDDHDLRLNVKKIGIEFGQLAVRILDLAYQESKTQTMRSLRETLPDFNDIKLIDLARLGRNKYFVAHPCCQRLIYSIWTGYVRITTYNNIAMFKLPDFLKMMLSMILIFPSYLWIDIVYDSRYTKPRVFPQNLGLFNRVRRRTRRNAIEAKPLPFETVRSVYLIQKLYYMWTAPMTKYWLTQVFYMVFLAVFSVFVMSPFCGDSNLNMLVVAWLFILFVDHLFLSVAEKKAGSESTIPKLSDLLVTAFTLVIVVVFRILRPTDLPFHVVKSMLCCSLIFFFYKAMGLMFPASQALGPTFFILNVMMKQDLVRWLRIWSLTLISGAIAIHAVLYPAYPLDVSAVSKAFLRGFLGLFLVDISDLGGDTCSVLYNTANRYGCDVESMPDIVREKIETCPYSSFGGYFVVLLYLFDTKLVYYTLIFAVCSATMSSTYARSVEVWKYQFFVLVCDYEARPSLPVPFVILVYPILLLKAFFSLCLRCVRKCCGVCLSQDQPSTPTQYNMWRAHIKTLKKQERMEMGKKNMIKDVESRLEDVARQQRTFRRVVRNLNDRLTELLSGQTSNSLMMEQLTETVEALRLKKMDAELPKSLLHRQCRLSPYPGTSIRRYAVFDKNVPWEEAYPNYDPPVYTKPIAEFDETLRPFVDPDYLRPSVLRQSRLPPTAPMTVHQSWIDVHSERGNKSPTRISFTADSASVVEEREFQLRGSTQIPSTQITESYDADNILELKPEFNAVHTETTRTGEAFVLDRTSWMPQDSGLVPYQLDLTGVPRNPMGRTGMRGRGSLFRWGPNHAVYAIVSRWRSSYNTSNVSQGPLLINGKKILEIMVIYNERLREDSLPGWWVSGTTSKYSVMCEMFMRDLMGERDVPGSADLDQDDMIQFYRQFISEDLKITRFLGRAVSGQPNFRSSMVYRGYIDDRFNTDNAWMEAEIWSFHYNTADKFDKKIVDNERRWREVSVLMRLAGSQLQHVLEVAKELTQN